MLQLIDPFKGQEFSRSQDEQISIHAEPSDETGLSQVVTHMDGRRTGMAEKSPFVATWSMVGVGEHSLFVRAYDLAGNNTESGSVSIEAIP
ncbi:MAG: hypothetical protein PVF70_01170 [Anaerolineales bacterium]